MRRHKKKNQRCRQKRHFRISRDFLKTAKNWFLQKFTGKPIYKNSRFWHFRKTRLVPVCRPTFFSSSEKRGTAVDD